MKTQNHKLLSNKCPRDNCKNQAQTHPIFGILPCSMHQEKDEHIDRPEKPHEMTSANIREGRRQYFKSALQPWRHHVASKEFMEAYPNESKEMYTEKEKKKAQYVWSDLPNAKNWRNTR